MFARVHRALLDILSDKHSPTDKDNLFACVAASNNKKRKHDALLDALPVDVLHWLQQHALVKTGWPQRLREWEQLTPQKKLVPTIVINHELLVPRAVKKDPLDAFCLLSRPQEELTKEKAIEAALSRLFIRTTARLTEGFTLALPQQTKLDTFSFAVEFKGEKVGTLCARWTARKPLSYVVLTDEGAAEFVTMELMLVFLENTLASYKLI
jgi:hypothetical protein